MLESSQKWVSNNKFIHDIYSIYSLFNNHYLFSTWLKVFYVSQLLLCLLFFPLAKPPSSLLWPFSVALAGLCLHIYGSYIFSTSSQNYPLQNVLGSIAPVSKTVLWLFSRLRIKPLFPALNAVIRLSGLLTIFHPPSHQAPPHLRVLHSLLLHCTLLSEDRLHFLFPSRLFRCHLILQTFSVHSEHKSFHPFILLYFL